MHRKFRNSLDNLFDDLAQAKRDDPVVAFDTLQGVLASLNSDFKAMKDCLSQLREAKVKKGRSWAASVVYIR